MEMFAKITMKELILLELNSMVDSIHHLEVDAESARRLIYGFNETKSISDEDLGEAFSALKRIEAQLHRSMHSIQFLQQGYGALRRNDRLADGKIDLTDVEVKE